MVAALYKNLPVLIADNFSLVKNILHFIEVVQRNKLRNLYSPTKHIADRYPASHMLCFVTGGTYTWFTGLIAVANIPMMHAIVNTHSPILTYTHAYRLPKSVRITETLAAFRKQLKTHLFRFHYLP